MKGKLFLTPAKMCVEIMEELERRGLIERLAPSREKHRVPVAKNEGRGEIIYVSGAESGGHTLVACAIDNDTFSSFATHQENEEFLLLGGVNERPMYLLVCLLGREELLGKMNNGTLTGEDFVLLDCVFNDPEVSFFIMKEGVPHGESAYGVGRPATFYVTECEGIRLDKINLYSDYEVIVREEPEQKSGRKGCTV